jgi:hypothetical protein
MSMPLLIAHGDEWVLTGYFGAGNTTKDKKNEAGFRHAVNEALRLRPALIVFGEHAEAPMDQAAKACHAVGFVVFRCTGRGVDGVYTLCGDQPDEVLVRVIGQAELLGQLRELGCEANGNTLEMSALQTMQGIGPKIAAAILAEGDPAELMQRTGWLPKCKGAEKVRAAMTAEAYTAAIDELKLRRVPLQVVEGEQGAAALRALGLWLLADRIEEAERGPA